MKRFSFLGFVVLVTTALIMTVPGCPGKKEEPKPPAGKSGGDGGGGNKGQAKAELDAPLDGKITGVVEIKGAAPDMKVNPAVKSHGDNAICLASDDPFKDKDQIWIIKDNKVANVVIWLKPPSDKKFKITDELKAKFKDDVVVKQPFCQYEPHVIAVFLPGQNIKFESSPKLGHNVHMKRTENNAERDSKQMSANGPPFIVKDLAPEEEGTTLSFDCNTHTWMTAKALTFEHPYFAVTDRDGKFEISNVPSGVDLEVTMWHESKPGRGWKETSIKLDKGQTKELKLTIEASK